MKNLSHVVILIAFLGLIFTVSTHAEVLVVKRGEEVLVVEPSDLILAISPIKDELAAASAERHTAELERQVLAEQITELTSTTSVLSVSIETLSTRVLALEALHVTEPIPDPEPDPIPPTDALADIIANMTAGDLLWFEIPGTAVHPHLVQADEFDYCEAIKCFDSANAFYAWNGAALDRESMVWHFTAGGGHADYGGNENYAFDFKTTLSWARTTDPQPLTGRYMVDSDGDGVADRCSAPATGLPASHTYDGNIWLPEQQRVLVFPSFPFCQGDIVWGSAAWLFDPATGLSEELPLGAPNFARAALLGNGLLAVFSINTLTLIDPATFETAASHDLGVWWADGNMAYHAARNELYLINDRDAATYLHRINPDTGDHDQVTELPFGWAETWSIEYHPGSGRLVFWNGGSVVWAFDPGTGNWESFESAAGPAKSRSYGVYSKWVYLGDDVFAGYDNVGQGVWLFRLPASGSTPAPAPAPEPAPAPADSASFDERCAAAGVILCDPLDSGRVSGVGIDETTPCATLAEALDCRYGDWRWVEDRSSEFVLVPPALDTEVKASGDGSLRFTIPSNSGQGAEGYFQTNFTPDNSVQFGPGGTFFVQWRQRFSRDMLFDETGARRRYAVFDGEGGFKTIIVNAGDHPLLSSPTRSCSQQEIVFGNLRQQGQAQGYHSCGWFEPFWHDMGLHQESGNGQWDVQPGGDNDGQCLMLDPVIGIVNTDAMPGCIMFWPDEWMTFQMRVTVGPWTSPDDPARAGNIKLWVAREGQPSVLAFDHDLNFNGPWPEDFLEYGKVWLLPFHTAKDWNEEHPEAYVWYDELIVSTGRIAEPS